LIFFQQTLIEKFSSDFDFLFSNAITITIEKPIRINQTLIEKSGCWFTRQLELPDIVRQFSADPVFSNCNHDQGSVEPYGIHPSTKSDDLHGS